MSNLPANGKAYIITNVSAGTVVDLNAQDLKTVAGWSKNGGQNQNWIFMAKEDTPNNYRIYNQQAGTKAHLTAMTQPDSNGLYPVYCLPHSERPADDSQLWALAPIAGRADTFVIGSVGRATNVLDLAGGNSADGTEIITYADHSGDDGKNQHWRITLA